MAKRKIKYEFTVEDFPACCGFTVLCDFPDHYTNKWLNKSLPKILTQREKEECLAEIQTSLFVYITSDYEDLEGDDPKPTAGVFATLNELQNKCFGPVLEEYGFELFLDNAKNPNTGRNLYAYYFPISKAG